MIGNACTLDIEAGASGTTVASKSIFRIAISSSINDVYYFILKVLALLGGVAEIDGR